MIFLLIILCILNCIVSQNDSNEQSLIFIIENTQNMEEKKEDINVGIKSIIDIEKSKSNDIKYEFMLYTVTEKPKYFSTTKSDDEFLKSFKSINYISAMECPEPILSAIEMASDKAKSFSTIYILTDGSAKDPDKLENVLKLLTRKRIKVNILTFGDCPPDLGNSKVYDTITKNSSGFKMTFNIDEINKKKLETAIVKKLDPCNITTTPIDIQVDYQNYQIKIEIEGIKKWNHFQYKMYYPNGTLQILGYVSDSNKSSNYFKYLIKNTSNITGTWKLVIFTCKENVLIISKSIIPTIEIITTRKTTQTTKLTTSPTTTTSSTITTTTPRKTTATSSTTTTTTSRKTSTTSSTTTTTTPRKITTHKSTLKTTIKSVESFKNQTKQNDKNAIIVLSKKIYPTSEINGSNSITVWIVPITILVAAILVSAAIFYLALHRKNQKQLSPKVVKRENIYDQNDRVSDEVYDDADAYNL